VIYYNEIDKYCCDVIEECIRQGVLPQGEVDRRPIQEVEAGDLKGFDRCHFFAGLGLWELVLTNQNWCSNTWTGSCPCQPFSGAGKKEGFNDERHLWPEWFRLVAKCKPKFIFGEQVAGQKGLSWFDLVSSDLEAEDYACGSLELCSAGLGAPHARHRLYWFASGPDDSEWDFFAREEPCDWRVEGVGWLHQPASWASSWQGALARLRTLDDGNPFVLPATDAIRNAISPSVAEEFVSIVKEVIHGGNLDDRSD
jgi:DNA (cytosine-5)-methyltransferase 1